MNLTTAIILFNIFGFFLQNTFDRADLIFGLNRYFYEASLFWQPLTSMFMHGGLTHLGMNMLVLFQFGTLIERERGKKYFLILYIIGGVSTSLFSFIFMYSFGLNHVLVGASGAIFVLFGWIAHKDTNHRKGIIVAVLLISFVPMFMGVNIAWYSHLIGFCIGWIIFSIKK